MEFPNPVHKGAFAVIVCNYVSLWVVATKELLSKLTSRACAKYALQEMSQS